MKRSCWVFLLTLTVVGFGTGCDKQREPKPQSSLTLPTSDPNLLNRRFNGPPPVKPSGPGQLPNPSVQ
jgi:hypothetical protein